MLVGASVLAIVIAAPPGDAAPALRWSAPDGCPSQDEVEALLAAEASGDDRATQLATDASVRETPAGKWALTIAITSPGVEIRRELELDSCAAAAEALTLVYGMALAGRTDPEVEPTPTVPEPAIEPPPPAATPEPRRPEPAPPPPTPAPIVRERPQLVIHLDAGGGVGTLTRGGGGNVLFGIGPAWRRVRFGVRVDHAIVRRATASSADAGARMSTTTGGIELAIPVPLGPVELLPGVDIRGGGLRARGIGGRRGDTRWVPWAVAAGGVTLVWMPADVVGVRIGAALEVPLVRHTFVFDALEIVRTARVGGLFVAGIELRLPRRPR